MDLQTVANNVRGLRSVRRMSQSGLAEAAGLSLPAIKSLEGAKCQPRVRTLQAIAGALGVSLQDLFAPARDLHTVRFRSAKRMQNRNNILADVARWLEDFSYLERLLDQRVEFRLASLRAQCSEDDPVGAATLCRLELGLKPSEPIHDICGLLEHAGVKVRAMSIASDSFFGLSVSADDGGPAVVVNGWERITVERRIFTAAHELGHLMLHPDAYDVAQADENKDEERDANRFAAHFLMPDDGFLREWNDAAGLHLVDRVLKVKRIFRVSYKTVLSRLIEKGAVNDGIWPRFSIAYQERFGRKLQFKEEPLGLVASTEPFGMQPHDFYEDRFSRLAREAVERGLISLGRGAEMLRIGIEEMRELSRDWEAVA